MGERTKRLRDAGLRAAARRLPEFALQIGSMMDSDEVFRGICDDLAEVDAALCALHGIPKSLQDARREEYEQLAKDLTAEIEDALRQSKIVPINRWPRGGRGRA